MRGVTTFGDFDALIARLADGARRLNSLPEWFAQTTAGQAAEGDAEDRHLSGRANLVRQRGELRQERNRQLAPIERDLPAARQRLAAAEVEVRKARARVSALDLGAHSVRVSCDHREATILQDLRMTSDPLIVAFVEVLRDEWERTRRTPQDSTEYGRPNRHGDRPRVSNRESIAERLDGIRAAIERCEQLKIEPLGRAEVIERLREIHDDVPELRPAEAFVPPKSENATIVPFASAREPADRATVLRQRYGG